MTSNFQHPTSNFQTTLTRHYLCAQCHAPLTRRRRLDGRRGLEVVCSRNPDHRGFWRKSTVELRERLAVLEAIELKHTLRAALPWLPEPDQVDAEQAIAELYG